jgi:hypothetical protein
MQGRRTLLSRALEGTESRVYKRVHEGVVYKRVHEGVVYKRVHEGVVYKRVHEGVVYLGRDQQHHVHFDADVHGFNHT